jgi:hypothetical protein
VKETATRVAANTLHTVKNQFRKSNQVDDAEYERYKNVLKERKFIEAEEIRLAIKADEIVNAYNDNIGKPENKGDTVDTKRNRENLINAKTKDIETNTKAIQQNASAKTRNENAYKYFINTNLSVKGVKGEPAKTMVSEFEERDNIAEDSEIKSNRENFSTVSAKKAAEAAKEAVIAEETAFLAGITPENKDAIINVTNAKNTAFKTLTDIKNEIASLAAKVPPETASADQIGQQTTAQTNYDTAAASFNTGDLSTNNLYTKYDNIRKKTEKAESDLTTATTNNTKSIDAVNAAISAQKNRRENAEKYRQEREAEINAAKEEAAKNPKPSIVDNIKKAIPGIFNIDDTCIVVPINIVPASVDCISVNLRRFTSADKSDNTRFYADAIQFKNASQGDIGEPVKKEGDINKSLFATNPTSMQKAFVAIKEEEVAMKNAASNVSNANVSKNIKVVEPPTDTDLGTYESQLKILLFIDGLYPRRDLQPGSLESYRENILESILTQQTDIITTYAKAENTPEGDLIKTKLDDLINADTALKPAFTNYSNSMYNYNNAVLSKIDIENKKKELDESKIEYTTKRDEHTKINNELNVMLRRNQNDKSPTSIKITKSKYLKNLETVYLIINTIVEIRGILSRNILDNELIFKEGSMTQNDLTKIRFTTLRMAYVFMYFLEVAIPDFIKTSDKCNSDKEFTPIDILSPNYNTTPKYVVNTIETMMKDSSTSTESTDPPKYLSAFMNATSMTITRLEIADMVLKLLLIAIQDMIGVTIMRTQVEMQISNGTSILIYDLVNKNSFTTNTYYLKKFFGYQNATLVTQKGGKTRARNARRAERRATRRLESAPM